MADRNYLRTLRQSRLGLLIAGAVLMALAIGTSVYLQQTGGRHEAWISLAKQISADVSDLARIGQAGALGLEPDFATLVAARETLDANIKALREGDAEVGISSIPLTVGGELDSLQTAWSGLGASLDDLLSAEAPYRRAAGNVALVAEATPRLFEAYEGVAQRLAQRGASTGQIFATAGQLVRLERIRGLASQLLTGGNAALARAGELEQEAQTFAQVNRMLTEAVSGLDYTPLRDNAGAGVEKDFEPVLAAVAALKADAEPLDRMQKGAAVLKGDGANVLATAKGLEQALIDSEVRHDRLPAAAAFMGVLALLFVAGFIYVSITGLASEQAVSRDRDAAQQQAILRLLDEITNLANGDLTGELTVSEDFTGNIADSLNYTVQTLRELVGTINRTSVEIAAAASSTANSAERMSEASEGQAREIVQATRSINTASRSLEDVAGRAEKLAEQAKSSVEVAHNGAATVGRTIQGMSTLREQIQDTAKRIKRLGESSQEIGNIIEFINDIAEQTNTLALNASIQAAMAGEAGRGFAVVADEVQRLAERAGSATRQIETLVKTIQADTQEAVTSMERSTTNVVGGAKSAEEAGLALTRVEASSQELAKLIQEIAGAARGQSAETTRLADTMQGIRQVAVQTSSTAQQTAEAVGELSVLSEKLRESVAGFKLPTDLNY
ncbi:MAG: methyl-accepting chemotaxis protein [Stagnimonas sp.]|nr:methyl-accepting chemotaxis protein [Stagnimonas sp.]